MNCSECEYYQKCPVGFKKLFFETDEIYLNCEELNRIYDMFVRIKEVRNEWKKDKEEKYPLYSELSYFG